MFKPMLAVNTIKEKIPYPVMGSFKLEGVRGEFTPNGLVTRGLKKFGNSIGLRHKFKILEQHAIQNNLYIEGEFYKHGMLFNEISSICRRYMHEDTDLLEFHIFDILSPDISLGRMFRQRYNDAIGIIAILESCGQKDVFVIDQFLHYGPESIQKLYELAIEDGYEGYCLKDPDGLYKFGRSTVLQGLFTRMKPEDTWDGKVIEIVEMFENLSESKHNELGYLSKKQDKDLKMGKGMAAVAVCICNDFPGEEIRVTLSRGLTDGDRKNIWDNKEKYLDRHLRFIGIPVKGMLPRSPRFDVWRIDLD